MSMETAIRSGRDDEVEGVLARMSETEAVEQLTHKYGRGREMPDDDGLFEGTTPILHAARSGKPAVFSAVVRAIRARMNSEQVNIMFKATDSRGRSVLAMAARGGSHDVFLQALKVFKNEFTDDQLQMLLLERGYRGRSLLSTAALEGDKASFETIFGALKTGLSSDQIKTLVMSHDDRNNSVIHHAAMSKCPNVFGAVMSGIEKVIITQELQILLLERGYRGRSLLSTAALEGDKTSFEAVLDALQTRLRHDQGQVKTLAMSRDDHKNSIIHHAARNKSPNVFEAVMFGIETVITPQEMKALLLQRGFQGRSLLITATREGDKTSFEAVLDALQKRMSSDQVTEQLTMKTLDGHTLLREAFDICNATTCRTVLRSYQDYTTDEKVREAIEDSFLSWAGRYSDARKHQDQDAVKLFEELLSRMLRHSSRVPPGIFSKLAHDAKDGNTHDWEPFTQLVLEEVESAKNPLVPGINISVALTAAAEVAREGEGRKMSDLKGTIDSFIQEVFERLPQTVHGFEDGIYGCCDLLEPEGKRDGPNTPSGPLQMAFKHRQQMENLCSVPLVMDYISAKFTHGLPDVRDTHGVRCLKEDIRRIAKKDGDPIDARLSIDSNDVGWRFFQGIRLEDDDSPTVTFLPGAQFIIAGLVTKPQRYYKVPAMRMAMEFVVYLAMLAAYTQWVLLTDDGHIKLGEVLFAGYILAGGYAEIEELRRGWNTYRQDPWNFLDLLGLIMLFGGFIVRLSDNESLWGRGLYALSAPLMFSRVLFFAQILRFQGPMIQAIFIMGLVLVRFGVVLLVVMMSFAMSFFALFREVNTFDAILLHLFKTILGDVEYFDDFDDSSREQYAVVGQVLLSIFVIVMTIMLLNLLIAILSTTHADVHKNAEREFKISKARTVQHYRLVVEHDILPAPFNLLQLFVSMSFVSKSWQRSTLCRHLKRAVGLLVFWLTLGPIAVMAGLILWVISSIGIPSIICDALRSTGPSTKLRPFIMLFFWGLCLGSSLWWGFGYILTLFISPNQPSMSMFWLIILHILSVIVARHFMIKYRRESVVVRLIWSAFLFTLWMWSPYMWTVEAVAFLSGGQSSESSTEENARQNYCVDVHAMLRDSGTSAKELRKYLDNRMIDPVVQRDEVDRVATVKDLKLLRDLCIQEITKIHSDICDRMTALEQREEKRISALRDEIVDILKANYSSVRADGGVAYGT